MKTQDTRGFPQEEEIQQLRARIARLKEEISLIRGGKEGLDNRVAEALHESDLMYKQVFDNIIARLKEEISLIRGDKEGLDNRVAEALHESDLMYRQVFDNVSVCMFLVDVTSDGRFKYAAFNAAEEKAVGLTNDEVCGKFVEEVFAEDLAKKLNSNYRRCVEVGSPIYYEDELDLPGGRRYFNSNLIPMRNESATVHRIIGACIDITDFKRSQDEALARQKLESLGVLAGGIAHDFNNLLGSILAQAELAEAELAAGSVPRHELQLIKNVAIRAGEMVRELMVYSGQDPATRQPLDLSGLVGEMLELLKISISKQALLTVDLPRNLPAVRANAVQIRQVVLNLITNASEALGEQKGVISVTIAKGESGQDLLPDRQPSVPLDDYLRLEVSDTGCGMTEEVLSKIFDPFFTTKFAGRGLGLAAVQGIIRGHGGTINVVSSPGQGTRFQVLIPCIGQAALDSEEITLPTATPDMAGVTGTVLVVEDEELLRLVVSKRLRKEGFFVIEAGDGATGASLFLANERKIDVVLLDWTLPGISGQDLLAELKRIRPDIKVILTTAYGPDVAFSSIGKLHSWSYVRKPYQFSEILNLLRLACLDKQRTSTAAG